jgi:hypothetical protein
MKSSLLLTGLALLVLGCGSSKSSSDGGGTGGTTSGTGGNKATGGATGTGGSMTATGGTTGTGGTAPATGGTTGTGGSAGAKGTGGTSATGGTTGTGGSGGACGTVAAINTDTAQSVLQRNKHGNRDGNFVEPTLTTAMAGKMALDTGFAPKLTAQTSSAGNNVWASPLYLQNGPGGKGVYIAVTTGNDVYALDETTGATVWTKNMGSAPTMNQSSSPTCGSIHPLGIISTPAIDGSTTPPTIYAAGAVGTTSIMSHKVYALSSTDGSAVSGWPVDVSNSTSGSVIFATPYENQRSALSLVGSTLYVAYGGHIGDCGGYHGFVIGINTQNPAMRGAWATAGQGEGIWAAGGMASDGNGVFALTGNNTQGTSTHMDSEEAVRITGLGTLSDSFYDTNWKAMDGADADLGASSPLYIEVPGQTPSKMVVAVSKDGFLNLLDAGKLGGAGGQKARIQVAGSGVAGGMLIHTTPASYVTSQGMHVTFGTDSSANCPAGMPSGRVIMSVLIPACGTLTPKVVWCAPLSSPTTGPISTTTDGISNVVVWYMSGGKLMGVDGDTGTSIYAGTDTCSNVPEWSSPIAANGHIVAAGNGHLCSWSPH